MKVCTFSTASATCSSGTLTASGTISSGDWVQIGDTKYTFRTTLSTGPAVAYEVLIGGSVAAALDNLKLAINGGAGIGTNYSTGTAVNEDVEATDNDSTTQKVEALEPTKQGDDIATTKSGANLAWGGATLSGGGILTVTGQVDEETLGLPSRQVTVGQFPEGKPGWFRSVTVSDEAVRCSRANAGGLVAAALWLESIALLASSLEPGMTWVPEITTEPSDDECYTAGGTPDDAVFTVVASSETGVSMTYQWQESSDGSTFANVSDGTGTHADYSGSATASLTVSPKSSDTELDGYKYRCVVTNAAGSTNSQAATLSVTAYTP